MFLTLHEFDKGFPVRANFDLVKTFVAYAHPGGVEHSRILFVDDTPLHVRETASDIDAMLKDKES